eukprot:m.28730 g.28730  ORF g.28730 m.28730 type:complete len:144 (-) comp6084_c0_seq1:87-518(-)
MTRKKNGRSTWILITVARFGADKKKNKVKLITIYTKDVYDKITDAYEEKKHAYDGKKDNGEEIVTAMDAQAYYGLKVALNGKDLNPNELKKFRERYEEYQVYYPTSDISREGYEQLLESVCIHGLETNAHVDIVPEGQEQKNE